MVGSWKAWAAGAAALSMLGVAGVGLAQDQPPPGAHGPMEGGPMGGGHMREHMQQMQQVNR